MLALQRLRLAAAVAVLATCCGPLRAEDGEETAVKVYNLVQGAVVALKNAEGSGTGLVLDKTGLILTNAHVVASPLPFTCKVDVRRRGKTEAVTLEKVTLLGFHKHFDLALVRIDPAEFKGDLFVAKLSTKKASPGQSVFAIGNPGSGSRELELNKTITAGILSGVDRVIEGTAYYQVDAPINPGNSGGPLCDRNGEVLGVVTLKLNEVDNVGFAIPIFDLKFNGFVPLTEREVDAERAQMLAQIADEMAKRAVDAAEREGSDSPEAQFRQYMALRYYQMALTENPKDARIWQNVGILLTRLESYEAAIAYLLQGIQIDPWTADDYLCYRELALALEGEKKPAEAQVARKEGVDKFPAKAGKIWEDLAIYHANHEEPLEAAIAAATALKLDTAELKRAKLREILDASRSKLSTQQQAKFSEEEERIDLKVKQATAAAQKHRDSKRAYINKEFEQLVKNRGAVLGSHTGEVALTKDDEGEKPEDAKKTKKEDPAAKLDLTIPAGSVNLLTGVNVKHDAVKGDWKLDAGKLLSPFLAQSRIVLPEAVPEEYDLTLIVERKSNRSALVIGFVRGGRQSVFFLDAGGTASGVNVEARTAHQGTVLTNNKPATVVLKVRREGLQVLVDKQQIYLEKNTTGFPAVAADWQVPDNQHLFLGADLSRYVIYKAMLTPIKRKAK